MIFKANKDQHGLLLLAVECVAKASERAIKALDDLGLTSPQAAQYAGIAEAMPTKLNQALGDALALTVQLSEPERDVLRTGCIILLDRYQKMAAVEAGLFVDTAATHDRSNDVRELRDRLNGQESVVQEPKHAKPRDAAGTAIMRAEDIPASIHAKAPKPPAIRPVPKPASRPKGAPRGAIGPNE